MRFLVGLLLSSLACAEPASDVATRARQYLIDLIRIDTTNPPGNETRVAEYLKQVATANGISCELVGDNPSRLNFIARIPATSPATSRGARPLLLMAHSDVVPADRTQWSVDPFSAGL